MDGTTPGIGGVRFPDTDHDGEREAERLREGLAERGVTAGVHPAGDAFLLADTDALGRAGTTTVAADGYAFDGEEPVADRIAALYEAHGTAFLDHLDGTFRAIIHDGDRGRLHLVTDRTGSRPLKYARRGGGMVAASQLTALLACRCVDQALDRQSVLEYLATTGPSYSRDATLVRGVNAVRPAEIRTWDGDDLRRRTYWDPAAGAALDITDREAVARTRDLLVEAAEVLLDRAHGPPVVPFSGGMDSRFLAALLDHVSGGEVTTYTLGGTEARLGHSREVAAALGTEHREIRLPERAISTRDVWRANAPTGAYHAFRPTLLLDSGVTECFSGVSAGGVFPPEMPRLALCDRLRPLHRVLETARIPGIVRRLPVPGAVEIGTDILAGRSTGFSVTYERYKPARSRIQRLLAAPGEYDLYAPERAIDARWPRPRRSFRQRHAYLELRENVPNYLAGCFPTATRHHDVFGYPPLVAFQHRLPYGQRQGRRLLARVAQEFLPSGVDANPPHHGDADAIFDFYFRHGWDGYRARIERFLERGILDPSRGRGYLLPAAAPEDHGALPRRQRILMMNVESLEVWISSTLDRQDGWTRP